MHIIMQSTKACSVSILPHEAEISNKIASLSFYPVKLGSFPSAPFRCWEPCRIPKFSVVAEGLRQFGPACGHFGRKVFLQHMPRSLFRSLNGPAHGILSHTRVDTVERTHEGFPTLVAFRTVQSKKRELPPFSTGKVEKHDPCLSVGRFRSVYGLKAGKGNTNEGRTVVRRHGEAVLGRLAHERRMLARRADMHGNAARSKPLAAQAFPCPRAEGGNSLPELFQVIDAFSERSGRNQRSARRRASVLIDTGDAAQFQHGAPARDRQARAYPLVVGMLEVVDGTDSEALQQGQTAAAYAPDLAHRDAAEQGVVPFFRTVEPEDAVPLLGDVIGQLGEGARSGYAHRDRDARPLEYAGAYLLRHGKGVGHKGGREAHETFIYGILLHLAYHRGHRLHDALRKVAVEFIVGREHFHAMLPEQRSRLEFGLAHGYAQRLGLLTARDDAAVVVGKHDHRLSGKVGPKEPLTRNVEVVAVDEQKKRLRACGRHRSPRPRYAHIRAL